MIPQSVKGAFGRLMDPEAPGCRPTHAPGLSIGHQQGAEENRAGGVTARALWRSGRRQRNTETPPGTVGM